MPCLWSPDTCKCKILYDQKTYEVLISHKGRKTEVCPTHSELDLKTELIQFVIPENQSANELYINWDQKDIESNINIIQDYKKAFREGKILEPIRDLTPSNARLAIDALTQIKRR